jgi:hypothetical protein
VKNAYRCGGGIANDHVERKYLCLHKKAFSLRFYQPEADFLPSIEDCAKLVALRRQFRTQRVFMRPTSKKKQDKAPTPCEEEQYNRFIEAAREFECDENVEALERAVREIVPRKSGDR